MCAPVPKDIDIDPTNHINRMMRQSMLLPMVLAFGFGLGAITLGVALLGHARGWW